MADNVRHPKHYNLADRRECWDEMIEFFGKEEVAIFDVLNAYKYYYRRGNKDGNPREQDNAKIDAYMKHAKWLIESSGADKPRYAYNIMKLFLESEEK